MTNNYNQFRAMLAVTKASLIATFRSPQAIFFSLFFPVVLIWIFGSLSGSGSASVDVAFEKTADTTNMLFQQLRQNPFLHVIDPAKKDIEDELRKGRLAAVIDVQKNSDTAARSPFVINLHTSSAFDNVSTTSNSNSISITEPLDQREQQVMQQSIERIYNQFKQRVAQGRKKDVNYIDSIAQGRVWSGTDALQIGLVDRIGTLEDAIAAAAAKAKLDKYSLLEYPESEGFMKQLLNRQKTEPSAMIKAQVGEDGYRVFQQLKEIKELTGSVQARLPYEIIIR